MSIYYQANEAYASQIIAITKDLKLDMSKVNINDEPYNKNRIEELRDRQTSKAMNQRAKYIKMAKSKDIIIMAYDKKIKELEEENKKLKEHFEVLRGKLYERL